MDYDGPQKLEQRLRPKNRVQKGGESRMPKSRKVHAAVFKAEGGLEPVTKPISKAWRVEAPRIVGGRIRPIARRD